MRGIRRKVQSVRFAEMWSDFVRHLTGVEIYSSFHPRQPVEIDFVYSDDYRIRLFTAEIRRLLFTTIKNVLARQYQTKFIEI